MNWIASTIITHATAPSSLDGHPPNVVASRPAPCARRTAASSAADRGRALEQLLLHGEPNNHNEDLRGKGEGRRVVSGGGGGGYRRTRGLAEPPDVRDDEPPSGARTVTTAAASTSTMSSRSVSIGRSAEETWRSHRRSSGNSEGPLRGGTRASSSSSAFRAVAGGGGTNHGAFDRVHGARGGGAKAPSTVVVNDDVSTTVQWHVHAYLDATQTLLFQVHQGPAPAHPPSSALHQLLSPSSQILSREEIGAFVRKRLLAGDENPAGSGHAFVSHSVHMSSDSSCWNHPLVQCLQSWIDGAGTSPESGSAPTRPAHGESATSGARSASSRGDGADTTDSDDEDDDDGMPKSKKQGGGSHATAVTGTTVSRRGGGGVNSTVVGRLGRSLRRQVARAVSRSRSRAPSVTARSRASCGASQSQSQCPSRSKSKNSRAESKSAAGKPHGRISSRRTTCGDTQAATADEDTVHAVVPCPYRAAIPPPCRDPRTAASRGLPRERPKRPAAGRYADDGDGTARPGGAATGVVVPVSTSLRSRRRDDDRGDPAQPGRSRRGRSFSQSGRRVPGLGGGGSVGNNGFGRRAMNQDQGDWI